MAFVVAGAIAASGCGRRASDRASGAKTQPNASAATSTADAQAAGKGRGADRLAALWTYYDGPVAGGRQRSATVYSTDYVDTDGRVPRRVRLVFRDHPSWGASSYLLLESGDFNCYSGCTVVVKVDGDPPKRLKARRPKTGEAIAMFIDDPGALWLLTLGARTLTIDFPVKLAGTRSVSFVVGGLDRSKMGGW
jgi:hypothetical protein